jgi:hypothetical protein
VEGATNHAQLLARALTHADIDEGRNDIARSVAYTAAFRNANMLRTAGLRFTLRAICEAADAIIIHSVDAGFHTHPAPPPIRRRVRHNHAIINKLIC